MEESPLIVFALEGDAPPLRVLYDALKEAEYPASLGVQIAGEATEEELDSTEWETALLRWHDPEIHEVCLIERDVPGQDEEADAAIGAGLRRVINLTDSAGRLIVTDHLRRTQAIYSFEALPALLDRDDHPGWDAVDVLLRCLAENTAGIIYVATEGFCDADGEMLLDEEDDGEWEG